MLILLDTRYVQYLTASGCMIGNFASILHRHATAFRRAVCLDVHLQALYRQQMCHYLAVIYAYGERSATRSAKINDDVLL